MKQHSGSPPASPAARKPTHEQLVRQTLAARPPRPTFTKAEREQSGRQLLAMMQAYERDARPAKIHEANPDRPPFPTFDEWVRGGGHGHLAATPKRPSPAPVIPRVAAQARPRERRERHVARSTSGTSSGDPTLTGPGKPGS
jgi:hypothetical protein